MLKKIGIVFSLVLSLAVESNAQKNISKKAVQLKTAKAYSFKNYPLLEISSEQMQGMTSKVEKEFNREPAQISSDGLESLMSKDLEFKKFKDSYMDLDLVNNPLLIEAFIADYMTKIKEKTVKSNSVKFVVAQMQTFKAFRSFLYRIRPYVSQTSMTNSLLLTAGYNLNFVQKTYFNNKQTAGAVKYITEPFSLDDVSKEITTAQQFHDFLFYELYKHLQIASDMLVTMAAEDATGTTPLAIYDNQMVFLDGSFQDGIERYKAVSHSEVYAMVSVLESAMSQIAFSISYNFDGMDKVVKEMSKVHGFDGGLFSSDVEGLHAKKKREIIMKPEYASFLTLKPQSADSLNRSLIHLQRSVDFADSSWKYLNAQKNKKSYMLNYSMVEPYKNEGSLTVSKWKELVNSKQPVLIRSAVTGQATRVQINSLFLEDSAIKDLKSLLPTAFNTANRKTMKKKIGTGDQMVEAEYRNFNYGSAEAWDLNVYKKVFPDLKSNADVPSVANILSTAWGSAGALAPFSFLLN